MRHRGPAMGWRKGPVGSLQDSPAKALSPRTEGPALGGAADAYGLLSSWAAWPPGRRRPRSPQVRQKRASRARTPVRGAALGLRPAHLHADLGLRLTCADAEVDELQGPVDDGAALEVPRAEVVLGEDLVVPLLPLNEVE